MAAFRSKSWGQYRQKYIVPQLLDRKAAQKNRKIDRNEVRRQSLRAIALVALLQGCGYQWQPKCFPNHVRPTIAVPYVSGDADGSLTQELIRSLVISGVGELRQWGADYRLQVTIVKAEGETIGYRRDRQQINGESKKNLLASEKRKTLCVEAALYEADSEKLLKGPFTIDARVDFDYVDGDSIQDLVFVDPHGVNQVVLPFSLGQLESGEAAEEAAMRPLRVWIAKKIIDAIFAG
ncbi:MAG TPA: LPS assembly lipoprotein LptE [Chlamydiales bacterium]|nr:LPS assembly lipoprotein LptE [Chlamydiales bacterium]